MNVDPIHVIYFVIIFIIAQELYARFGPNYEIPLRKELWIGQKRLKKSATGFLSYGVVTGINISGNTVEMALFSLRNPGEIELEWKEDIDDFQTQIAMGQLLEKN